MAMRVMRDGRATIMAQMQTLLNSGNFLMGLFQSNITPTQDDVLSTYLGGEATFSGYARVALASFSSPIVVGETAQITGQSCLFQVANLPSTGNQVYGYFVVWNIGGTPLMWAERFVGAPLSMVAGGSAIVVVPTLNDQSAAA